MSQLPGRVAAGRSSELRSVLAPFALRSFAEGYAGSDADIGAQALVELPDHSFLASAGAERNQVFHIGKTGSNASDARLEPLFSLDAPITDMAVDQLGQLWVMTGAELLQLDAGSGEIVGRYHAPGGDPLTHALAIDPNSGDIYASSGRGIEIFNPAEADPARAWRHFSGQRVGDLAFAADGRLWAVRWSGAEIAGAQRNPRSEIISLPLGGAAAGRAEIEYRLAGVIDSIAFGAAGTALEGLLIASSNLRQRVVNTGAEGTPHESPVWMIELASRRALPVASDGSRGESVVATTDGRILVAQTTRIDEIAARQAPVVRAITVPDGGLLPLPINQIGVVFDQPMWLGSSAEGADDATDGMADSRSVLNPANFTLTMLGAKTGAVVKPQTIRWDSATRTAWLEITGLAAGAYQIDVSASLQSDDEMPLHGGYASSFTALADMSSQLRLDFSDTRAMRATGEVSYDVRVTNVGDDAIRGPLILVLDAGRYFTDSIADAQPGNDAQAELWTIDLSEALRARGGGLAAGATIAARTIRVIPAGEFALRAGLADLRKVNLEHGVYAFPQDNLPPSLGLADVFDDEQLPAATVGEAWNATIEAIDPDSARLWWQLVEAPAGVTLTPSTDIDSADDGYHATATLTWTASKDADASTPIVVRVEDSRGGATVRDFRLPVIGGNHAPVIYGARNTGLAEGETLSLPLHAADADGDRLTLAMRNLPPGAFFDAASAVLHWTPGYEQAGVWDDVTLVASDGRTISSQSFTITVEQGYAYPTLATVAPQALREGEAWALQLAATVPGMIAGHAQADGTTLSLEYGARWLPGGATLDPQSGWLAWTPGFNQHGSYRVPISVVATWTTLAGETRRTATDRELVLEVANTNGEPIFESAENWQVIEGQALRISVFAFDPDNPEFEPPLRPRPDAEASGPETTAPSVSYQLTGLPAGAIFDAETLEIAWVPDYTQAGRYEVVITASDDGDGTGTPAVAQLALPIVVGNANRAPQIGDLGNAFVDAGDVIVIPVDISDADARPGSSPLTVAIDGLPRFATWTPPGAAANAQHGVIRFAPEAGDRGDYTITITATDDGDGNPTQALSTARSFVLSVRSNSEAPLIAAPRQVVAVIGQPLSVNVIASDLDQDPLSWTTKGLPFGAEFTASARYGQATLTWTPTAADLGSRDVELIATDSGLPPQGGGFNNPEQPLPNVGRHTLRIVARSDNAAPALLGVVVNGESLADADGRTIHIEAREGRPLDLEIFAQDSDADLIDWRVTELPRAMTFTADDKRAAFSWTPDLFAAQDGSEAETIAGLWHFRVTASDGAAEFVRDVEIAVANNNQPPRIAPIPLQLVSENETLAFALLASDPDGDTVHLSLMHD